MRIESYPVLSLQKAAFRCLHPSAPSRLHYYVIFMLMQTRMSTIGKGTATKLIRQALLLLMILAQCIDCIAICFSE